MTGNGTCGSGSMVSDSKLFTIRGTNGKKWVINNQKASTPYILHLGFLKAYFTRTK